MQFLATQYAKTNLTRGPSVPKSHTVAQTQTADNIIFCLAKGFEGLYLEYYRNQTKLLTLKITLKIV